MKAIWNNKTIAESDQVIDLLGTIYFPESSVRQEYFKPTDTTTVCGWKGTASYYNLVVDGKENKDAAWYYPEPMEKAKEIKGHVAFWKGVEIRE